MINHKLQSVRGTKDLYGSDIKNFNKVINCASKFSKIYQFSELQIPIFEFSEIYERNLGDASDIISKEVYKFKDRGDNFLTLRPEFTAGVVRAFLSNGELQQILPQKFFSYGALFRYDRPQKGRQRQFNQINFEIIGESDFYSDVEMILLASLILKDLGILNKTKLNINSLGSGDTKNKYETALLEYFKKYENDLSGDSKTRLEKNPLRILDSKDLNDISICENAPIISGFFSKEESERINKIIESLNKFGVDAAINERLVRGLDYYSSTVFEFNIDVEGAQNAVLGGGRYDNLIEKMGGKKTPAIGFAAGVERLMMLLEESRELESSIFVNYISLEQKNFAFEIAQLLRQNGLKADFIFDGNFKKQMKKANQKNARFVIIIGEDEIKNNELVVKDFKNSSEEKIGVNALVSYLMQFSK